MSALDVIVGNLRTAIESGDLETFSNLLDPHVTWGAPGDPSPPCQTRAQVLRWFANGREAGRRAHIRSVTTNEDMILVRMTVTTPDDPGSDRWEVLRVANGLVADIRGYDNEADARAAAGLTGSVGD